MLKRLVLVLLGLMVLTGCNANDVEIQNTPVPEGKPTVAPEDMPVVKYVQFKVFDPVYIGVDKGFFENHGIVVEFAGDTLGGPNAIQAVASGNGSAHAGLSSVPAIINSNVAGLPIIGVADVQTTLDGTKFDSDEPQALQRWFVLSDSDIEEPQDVVGHTYCVNIWRSSFHYTSLLMMNEWDIDEDEVEFKLLSFADQITALMAGECDVIGLIPPYQGYLQQEFGDEVRELWNDYELYGDRHVSLIFMNRIWAEYNPEIATAFVNGVIDSINWIEDNQEEAGQIVEEYTGVPASAIGDYHFTPNGEVRTEDVDAWLEYLIERGDVPDWLNAETIVDASKLYR